MNFRTKPVEVEAFQYEGDFQGDNGWFVPQWAVDALKAGMFYYDELDGVPAELFLKTPKGNQTRRSWRLRCSRPNVYDLFGQTRHL